MNGRTKLAAGAAAAAVVILIAAALGNRNSSSGFRINAPAGTEIRLNTFSESTLEVSGLAAASGGYKMTLDQRLRFTSPPGPTQGVELVTDSCFVDDGSGAGAGNSLVSAAPIEEAMRSLKVAMTIRPNGEPAGISPSDPQLTDAVAQNTFNSQIAALQATGPLGYTLKTDPPKLNESWTVAVDLMDTIRQSTNEFVTPIEASATYTYTYLGDTQHEGRSVHRIKRTGKGTIRQKLNVEGMSEKQTESTLTSEGEVLVDASTGLLVELKSTDKSVMDFGDVTLKQTTTTTTKGSRAK